eukprot:Gb_38058 [translate_table: standard]
MYSLDRWVKGVREVGKKVQMSQKLRSYLVGLSKFLLWSIWLERNNGIFNSIKPSIDRVLSRTKKLLGEIISVLKFKEGFITEEERSCLSIFSLGDSISCQRVSPKFQAKEKRKILQIHLDLNLSLLFFYGASRNNPGQAGLGVLLMIPNYSCKLLYWEGIGISSNNIAEAKALRMV